MRLRLIDEAVAQVIVDGGCPPGLHCGPDYPAEGDQVAARLFLERCGAGLDPRPFGAYLVCLDAGLDRSGELTIGGIGFHGGVDERGRVEIGYGIVPSEQGNGYATQALGLLIELAGELSARVLTAETDEANAASRAVLRHHDFSQTGSLDGMITFERDMEERP